MLEGIVVLELSKNAKYNDCEVFKLILEDGDIECVYLDLNNYSCAFYEVKRSYKINENKFKHLKKERIIQLIEHRFGKVKSRNVLYRGNSTTIDGINYININVFLFSNSLIKVSLFSQKSLSKALPKSDLYLKFIP